MNRAIVAALFAALVELLVAGTTPAFGEGHGGSATSAIDKAHDLIATARYAEAETLLRSSAEAQKEAGPSSLGYAMTLDLLGVLYTTLAKYSQADACLLEAAAICRRLPDKGGVHNAVVLTHRAKALEARADFAEAERLVSESLSLLEKTKSDKSMEYAAALAARADLEWDKGRVADARASYARAIELFQANDALDTAACATAQNSLGRLTRSFDPVQAEELIAAAKATRQKLFGEQHPEFGRSLVTEAIFLQSQAKTAAAEPLLRQAQEIYENALGEDHPEYATVVNALANAYRDGRNYLEAEPQARRAVDICENALGSRHPGYAAAWNNLAMVQMLAADYVEAEHAFTKAVGLYETIFDRGHPQRLLARDNLAKLYELEGNHRRAMHILEEERNARQAAATADPIGYARWLMAMTRVQLMLPGLNAAERQKALADSIAAIAKALVPLKKTAGADLERATLLEELARLNMAMAAAVNDAVGMNTAKNSRNVLPAGKGSTALSLKTRDQGYLRADELLKETLKIRKDYRGANHPEYALALESQAELYEQEAAVYPQQAAAYYRAAESNYVRVCKIREQWLGIHHPDYASALAHLADVYRAQSQDREEEAAAKYKQALQIIRTHLDTTAVSQPEQQQLAMTAAVRLYLDEYLSSKVGSPEAADDLYAEVLAWKGAVSRRQQTIRKMRRALAQENSEIRELSNELELKASELARLSHAELPADGGLGDARKLAELSEEVRRLESELAEKSADFRSDLDLRSRTPDDIRLSLPDNVALLDLLVYWHYPKIGRAAQPVTPEQRLLAFVVRHDCPTRFIELGTEAIIARAINDWLTACLNKRTPADPGALLRKLLWDPLENDVADVETVLISPDGATGWLPWGALPAKETNKFLIESQSFVMLPVPQMLPDILASEVNAADGAPTLLVVGDIDYDAEPGRSDVASASRTAVRGSTRQRWERLPGFGREVASITASFEKAFPDTPKPNVLSEDEATEQAVRENITGHRFVHFATHGLFTPADVPAAGSASASDRGPGKRAATRAVAGFHPGLLSAIVLAGANRPERLLEHDGMLTATEVEQLNVSGVKLVALSACQTGLGNTTSGEGLLGLQRAFQIGGAQSVVASLWVVPDVQTQLLLSAFYDNLWQQKLSRAAALRQAQIAMLNAKPQGDQLAGTRGMQFSAPSRHKEQRVPPYYWAAFVLSGDWR